MKPRFNDDFYCKTIEEFENEVVPGRVVTDQIRWFMRFLPIGLVIGGTVAPSSWRMWVAIAAMVYAFAMLFAFLEEINENIRFVRHQPRQLRGRAARGQRRANSPENIKSIDQECRETADGSASGLR